MNTVQRIFEIMEERGLTVYRVSKDTGISVGNIYNWKSGRSNPSAKALDKLAAYFDVPVDYLLGKIDNPQGILFTIDEEGTHYGISGLSKDEYELIVAQLEILREQKKRREEQD